MTRILRFEDHDYSILLKLREINDHVPQDLTWIAWFYCTVIKQATPNNTTDPCKLFSFDEFLRGRNLTRTTGYRYRKDGLLTTVNIFGRLYITRDEIENFERRAIAGEFAKEAKTPVRREHAAD